MAFGAAVPILRIFDEQKARDFYLDYIGFSVAFEHRFEPGMPIYMGLQLGDCRLHLSEHHGDGAPGARIRIQCDDLDAYHETLRAKPYKYARPGLQDMDWGTREMAIDDGFGNKLIFFRSL